jgi:hypothetical protein
LPDIEFIRAEILRTRLRVLRHRNEIMQLQRAGITSTSAEALLDRMLNKIDDLCAERNRLKRDLQHPVMATREGLPSTFKRSLYVGDEAWYQNSRWRYRGCLGGLS